MTTRTTQQLFDLRGKTALITGGSRGLGLQMAHALGEAGAKIMLSSRKAEDLEQAAAELQAAGIDARWIAADCAKEEDTRRLAEETLQRLGAIDILVNNAGASWGAPEAHPELSASPGARHNKTDQEWSIHVLRDATVLLNDGSCSMFRSTDLGRTFRAVQGEGGDPFHFNSTDGQSRTECPLPSSSQAAAACVQSAAPGACWS